jgi:NADH:ubiquinone oxidoreductase subunit 5 (subunit L)/multisubunit Na+/H+ antiporter MnhA subunit
LWLSLLSSVGLAIRVVLMGPLEVGFRHWFDSGSYHVSLGLFVHAPAAAMLVMTAAFIGVITRFSRNYLHRDPGFVRFFATMNLAAGGRRARVSRAAA